MKTRFFTFVAGAVLILSWACALSAQMPVFTPVPAVDQVMRDGLGNTFAKLDAGGPLRVAYLGGSITAANGWRPKTTAWLAQHFPKAQIHEIHAAIGGTGSDLGVYRLGHDVLKHAPDLLFVEFSVNDGGAAPDRIWRAMEGIVRQVWTQNPRCDICYVYTYRAGYEKDLREGLCPTAASADEMLAAHYGIPSINFALRITEMERAGKLIFQGDPKRKIEEGKTLFSQDGVHPIDAGHAIYAQMLSEAFNAWHATKTAPVDHGAKLKTPWMTDHWQQARLVPIEGDMLDGTWQTLRDDDRLARSFGHRLGTIWGADKPGQTLRFKFKGSTAMLYDLVGPDGGQIIVTVDGKTRAKPVARFDSYCTYHRLSTFTIASGLDPNQVHEVILKVHPDQPDRQAVAHRLKDPDVELKAPKYQGTRVWAGAIMMLGEPVRD